MWAEVCFWCLGKMRMDVGWFQWGPVGGIDRQRPTAGNVWGSRCKTAGSQLGNDPIVARGVPRQTAKVGPLHRGYFCWFRAQPMCTKHQSICWYCFSDVRMTVYKTFNMNWGSSSSAPPPVNIGTWDPAAALRPTRSLHMCKELWGHTISGKTL